MIKEFSLREEEIFQTLLAVKDSQFVLIGGYAVNTYTLPRFSVDCDIVIKENAQLKEIEKCLLKRKYQKEKIDSVIQYSGSFARYVKRIANNFYVSMDILIGSVKDRMSGTLFSAGWIFQNASKRVLRGKTISQELYLRIINIDALLVMKIISCRSTDIRDVFMMMPYANDKEWIRSEVTKRYYLKDRINKIIDKISSKQFKDGLCGVYGFVDPKVFEKHKKAIVSLENST